GVGSRCVTVRPCRSTASWSGSSGAPESTKTAVPPSSSATRYAFESQLGCMLRSTSTGGRLITESTRRADGRADATNDDADQGEVVEAARSCGEADRDPRLLLRATARAAPERQARRRRRGHGQETSA